MLEPIQPPEWHAPVPVETVAVSRREATFVDAKLEPVTR